MEKKSQKQISFLPVMYVEMPEKYEEKKHFMFQNSTKY